MKSCKKSSKLLLHKKFLGKLIDKVLTLLYNRHVLNGDIAQLVRAYGSYP